ncbi:MAG: S24 family peptidase [Stygiobacter sp.]
MKEQTLQIYFSGKSLPGGELLRKLAKEGADINFILTGERLKEKSDEKKGGNVYPIVTRLVTGSMIEFFDKDKQKGAAFNYDKKNGCMVLCMNDDSMKPNIENGDMVLLDVDAKIYDGCIVAARLKNGEQMIKRFRKLPHNLIQLVSDNYLFEPITIKMDDVEIIMPVVRIQRNTYNEN